MRKMTCCILGFLIAVITSSVCLGETLYVDQSGGGDFTTIAAGINAAYAGDTIKVGPGIYYENVVINKNIDLIGSGPKYTTINASENGITVQQNFSTNISNFTITAGGHGVFLPHVSVGEVNNCIIVGCGSNGIYSSASNSIVTITNNTIVYNNGSGIRFSSLYGSGYVQGNIVVYNGGDGIYSYLNSGIEKISYNNVYGNLTNNYSGCSAGTGDISFNPLFQDQDSGNYALQSASQCINSGIPGESFNDPDGTRNDMGAYSGPPSAAFWPYIPRGPVVTEVMLTPASVPRGGTITIQAKGRVQ